MMPTPATEPTPESGPEQQALQEALAGLMSSVARLGVSRGLPYAAVEEMLRLAFVQAAAQAHPGLPENRKVSRISTTTGLNRREVTRLVQQRAKGGAPRARSLASEVFAHWRTQPREGRPPPSRRAAGSRKVPVGPNRGPASMCLRNLPFDCLVSGAFSARIVPGATARIRYGAAAPPFHHCRPGKRTGSGRASAFAPESRATLRHFAISVLM